MTQNSIRKLLVFTRPYPWAIPVLVLLGLAASLAEGVGIGLMIPLLDSLLQSPDAVQSSGPLAAFLREAAAFVGGESAVVALGIAVVALVALKTLIVATDAVVSTSVIARAMRDLRLALCRQLLSVGYEYFARMPQGMLVNMLDAQTYRASEALRALTLLIGSLCTVVVFGVLLLLLSWQLTLVVALMVLPVSLVVRLLARWAHKRGDQLVQSYSNMADRILELLTSMRTIRIFNREALELERFASSVRALKRAYVRTEVINGVLPALVEFLYVPVFMAVLISAWYLEVGIPTVLVFVVLLYRLQSPLKRFDGSRVSLATYSAAIQELQALLDETDKPYVRSGSRPINALCSEIEFRHVMFRYTNSDTPAVDDVSLVFAAGRVSALVGDSGSGKSTLINLLCRFHDPASGSILADGIDLRELDLQAWRARIAFAGQDAELLTGSVRFNIAYGVDNATEVEIEAAAQMTQAHEFIQKLPAGYDTEVGPRGTQLSGGQRQRIALARAILCKPDILILDEATNAVDGITEMAIQQSVERLSRNTTIVMVAHRLSTVNRADHVVVMRAGKVVQQGSPRELLMQFGPFAQFYATHEQLEARDAATET